MKALLLAFVLANGGDALTTAVGFHRGCVEGNPLYGQSASLGRVLGVKVGLTVAIGAGAHHYRHEPLAKVPLVVWTAVGAVATAHNLKTLRSCR